MKAFYLKKGTSEANRKSIKKRKRKKKEKEKTTKTFVTFIVEFSLDICITNSFSFLPLDVYGYITLY